MNHIETQLVSFNLKSFIATFYGVCVMVYGHDDFICINYKIQLWFCNSCGFLQANEIDYPVEPFQIKLWSKCRIFFKDIIHFIHAICTSNENEASYSLYLKEKHTERMPKLRVSYYILNIH